MTSILRPDSLHHLLAGRDLTARRQGAHALQPLAREIIRRTSAALEQRVRVLRSLGIQRLEDGSLRLHASPAGALEEALDLEEESGDSDGGLLACFDRAHTLEHDGVVGLRTHRLTLWCRESDQADRLPVLIGTALRAALPGVCYRLVPDRQSGMERVFRVDVRRGDDWSAAGYGGRSCGEHVTGFVGLALDMEALLVLRKGLPERALIHSREPAVQAQMLDLEPWQPPSSQRTCRLAGER